MTNREEFGCAGVLQVLQTDGLPAKHAKGRESIDPASGEECPSWRVWEPWVALAVSADSLSPQHSVLFFTPTDSGQLRIVTVGFHPMLPSCARSRMERRDPGDFHLVRPDREWRDATPATFIWYGRFCTRGDCEGEGVALPPNRFFQKLIRPSSVRLKAPLHTAR